MRKQRDMRTTGRWIWNREPTPKAPPLIVYRFTDANGAELVTWNTNAKDLRPGDTFTFTLDGCSFEYDTDNRLAYIKIPMKEETT